MGSASCIAPDDVLDRPLAAAAGTVDVLGCGSSNLRSPYYQIAEAPKEADSIWHQIRQTIPSRSAMTASTIVFLTDEIAMEVFHPTDNQLNRKEGRKIGRPNRVRSNRVKSYHLVQAQLRRPKVDKSWFLTSTTAKKFQQVDARGSTVNNVGGAQFNIVVNNPTRAHIEEMDEDITTLPENPDVDPELNKYPPLVEFGLKVVMSTTNLVTTNITAAAAYIAEIPQIVKSNIQSITLKRTSFRYSFFSDEDAQPCAIPVVACPTCFHILP